MRKLLLLGGSSQQIIAIERAKDCGYYTILCDYLPDNPGQYVADKFYQVSTTDKEAILNVALQERVSGIVAYSSDPAAPTAAYVAERLGLPGIPYVIAETFCEKNMFRKYLEKNGFNIPVYREIRTDADVKDISDMEIPLIIKPSDSSGSKGVTVIRDIDSFYQARDYAAEYTKNGILLVEQYIERDHPDVIEAEIFVADGKVAVWGIMDTIRDDTTNPLLPAAYGYPSRLPASRIELVKKEVSRLIDCSEVKFGAFNIEMVIDKSERLYFIDVGPRNGGNMLPKYIGMIMHGDLEMATVCAAMGDYERFENQSLDGYEGGYWGLVVLHSHRDGIYKGVEYSSELSPFLMREVFFIEQGQTVSRFTKARDAVGLAFFKFETAQFRDEVLNDFEGKHIRVCIY